MCGAGGGGGKLRRLPVNVTPRRAPYSSCRRTGGASTVHQLRGAASAAACRRPVWWRSTPRNAVAREALRLPPGEPTADAARRSPTPRTASGCSRAFLLSPGVLVLRPPPPRHRAAAGCRRSRTRRPADAIEAEVYRASSARASARADGDLSGRRRGSPLRSHRVPDPCPAVRAASRCAPVARDVRRADRLSCCRCVSARTVLLGRFGAAEDAARSAARPGARQLTVVPRRRHKRAGPALSTPIQRSRASAETISLRRRAKCATPASRCEARYGDEVTPGRDPPKRWSAPTRPAVGGAHCARAFDASKRGGVPARRTPPLVNPARRCYTHASIRSDPLTKCPARARYAVTIVATSAAILQRAGIRLLPAAPASIALVHDERRYQRTAVREHAAPTISLALSPDCSAAAQARRLSRRPIAPRHALRSGVSPDRPPGPGGADAEDCASRDGA